MSRTPCQYDINKLIEAFNWKQGFLDKKGNHKVACLYEESKKIIIDHILRTTNYGGEKMREGDEYFKGNLNFGALGDKEIIILPNENREGNQPHYKVCININEKLRDVGVLWKNKKKATSTVTEEIVTEETV